MVDPAPDREKEIRERPLTAEEARIKAWNEDHATGYSEAWGERSWSRNANRHDAYAIGFADGAEYQRTNDETDAQALLAEIERLKDPSTILREAGTILREAAEIMMRWPNHAPYTQSGRGQIAVQELLWLADRLDSTGEGKE